MGKVANLPEVGTLAVMAAWSGTEGPAALSSPAGLLGTPCP